MKWFPRIFLRPRRRQSLYNELAEEMRQHLEERIEQLMRDENLPRKEAEQAARRAFGNSTLIEQRSREVWQWPTLESIWADIQYALRQLRKSPGFAITAIVTLMLAVGANTAVFSLMNALLLRSLPVPNPQQLVLFSFDSGGWPSGDRTNSGYSGYEFSSPLFQRFSQQKQLFSDVFGYASLGFNQDNLVLHLHGETMQATGSMVTGGFFPGLGVTPVLGRVIDENDLLPSAPRVAVISYAYWQRVFAKSPSAIGESITLNSTPYTIIGVASPGFTGVQPGIMDDLWIPITHTSSIGPWGVGSIDQSAMNSEKWWWLTVIGRLRPGVMKQQAAAAVSTQLVTTMATLNGGKHPTGKQPFIKLEDGSHGMQFIQGTYAQPAKLLMGLVGLVLLAACANLATLLLARASARSHEIAVRLAIGASPVRVWRQLLTESLLLSVTGGAFGVLIAPAATRVIAAGLTGSGSDQLGLDLTLDHRVLFFTAGLSIFTGLCFGIAPALRSSRIDVNSTLKDGATADTSRSRLPMRSLIIAQAAISTILLIVSGIFLHSLATLRSQATGIDQNHLLDFRLNPAQSGYTDEQLIPLYANLQQRLAALPGVRSVTTLGNRFLDGWENNFGVQIESYVAPDHHDPEVMNNSGGSHFLATTNIPLILGRDFDDGDTAASPKVAIINESMAKKFFATKSPIGYHITVPAWDGSKPASYIIVGVCRDARYDSLRNEIRPTWYQAIMQIKPVYLRSLNFMLRTDGNPAILTPSVMTTLHDTDPRLLATDVRTQSEQIDESLSSERMFAQLSTFFGMLALLLAAIGLYGTLAYSVARRQREMGIRLALGAQRDRLLRLVLMQGLRLVLLGILLGWIASALAGRLLASMIANVLFHVHALDALSFIGAATLLTTIAGTAALIPAYRAATVDPMQALRNE